MGISLSGKYKKSFVSTANREKYKWFLDTLLWSW